MQSVALITTNCLHGCNKQDVLCGRRSDKPTALESRNATWRYVPLCYLHSEPVLQRQPDCKQRKRKSSSLHCWVTFGSFRRETRVCLLGVGKRESLA